MRAAPKRHVPSRPRESVILFTIAAHKFALAAAAVDEIRAADGLTAVNPGGCGHGNVRYLLDRDHKTYYVVDGSAHFRLPTSAPDRVLLLHGSCVGLAVHAIDRMAEITDLYALPQAFEGEERRWFRGLAVIEDAVVPLLSPDVFATKAELALAQTRFASAASAGASA